MRTLLIPLFLLLSLVVPASAQNASQGRPVEMAGKGQAQRIDALFADLKRESNERAAQRIAERITTEWRRSGSASIDLMMQWAGKAAEEKKFDVALDFLDQVTTLKPDYAEGWNRRATVHFAMENYAKSMSDIERTLRLEPRHFGALNGMAEILKEHGYKRQALGAFERILAVYPMMRSAQREFSELSDELAGQDA